MRKLQNFLKLFVPASLFQWEQFFLLGVPSFFLPHTPKVLIVAVPNLYDCVRNKDIIIIIIFSARGKENLRNTYTHHI